MPRVKVVIVGCGRVGAALALRLAGESHSVTVVDQSMAAFARLGEEFGGQMIVGNGLEEGTLIRAGIEQADCFASVTNGDNRNLMMAQVAKHIFGVKRVITRLYDPIRADVYAGLGLETFCSTTIGSGIIAEFFDTGLNRGRALSVELAAPQPVAR
jgi:trk/ktr system potassium uptake protein